jgi:hypothetical protein
MLEIRNLRAKVDDREILRHTSQRPGWTRRL